MFRDAYALYQLLPEDRDFLAPHIVTPRRAKLLNDPQWDDQWYMVRHSTLENKLAINHAYDKLTLLFSRTLTRHGGRQPQQLTSMLYRFGSAESQVW